MDTAATRCLNQEKGKQAVWQSNVLAGKGARRPGRKWGMARPRSGRKWGTA